MSPFLNTENVTFQTTKRRCVVMLNDKQLECIELLMDGVNKTAIADKIKVNRKTIYGWLEKEEFKLELDRRKQEISKHALSDLKGDTKQILEAVKELGYKAESEAVRLQALNSLLDRILGKATAKQEIELSNTDNNTDVDLDSLLEDKDSNVIDLDKIAK